MNRNKILTFSIIISLALSLIIGNAATVSVASLGKNVSGVEADKNGVCTVNIYSGLWWRGKLNTGNWIWWQSSYFIDIEHDDINVGNYICKYFSEYTGKKASEILETVITDDKVKVYKFMKEASNQGH